MESEQLSQYDLLAMSQISQLEYELQELQARVSWSQKLSPRSYFRMYGDEKGATTSAHLNETLDSGIGTSQGFTTDTEAGSVTDVDENGYTTDATFDEGPRIRINDSNDEASSSVRIEFKEPERQKQWTESPSTPPTTWPWMDEACTALKDALTSSLPPTPTSSQTKTKYTTNTNPSSSESDTGNRIPGKRPPTEELPFTKRDCDCLCYCGQIPSFQDGPTPAQRLCSSIMCSLPPEKLRRLEHLAAGTVIEYG